MTAEVFFREFRRLLEYFPKLSDHVLFSENCDYCDYAYWSKNLVNSFDVAKSADSAYLFDSILCSNCIDCDYAAECELCYECENPFRCFNCEYLSDCARLNDSAYCYACTDCHHLFGCTHLANKSYCIFNRQFTPEEYKEQVKRYRALSAEKVLDMLQQLEYKYPRTQTFESDNENSEYGNYVYQCKNCYLCFDTFHSEECAYLYDCANDANCLDMTYSYNSDLSYELVDSSKLFNSLYCVYSDDCKDSQYLFGCKNCEHCLGCVHLENKKFCILNRQLTKEEYEKVANQILAQLKDKNPGWADFAF